MTHIAAVDVLPDFTRKEPRQRRRLRQHVEVTQHDAPSGEVEQLAVPALPQQRSAAASEELPVSLVSAQQLVAAIDSSLPATTALAVVHIGLDNFRHVNAAFGPERGDAALARAGALLARVLAPALVARMMGDSFAALLPHAGSAHLEHEVRRALSLLSAHDLSADGIGIRTTASAGITLLDRPGLTARGVLHEADLAMAAAKGGGRNRVAIHDAMATASAATMQAWARQIREGLDNDSFVLHAQPVQSVHQDTKQWELLLRLPAEDGELLPPGEFLPVAERFGLVAEVDRWVTKRAIGLIAAWASVGQSLTLEVNIGAATLSDDDFVAMVEDETAATGIDPHSLVFEVNGQVAGARKDDARVFAQRLKALGCRFALDGFGRNDGALEQLKLLPLDFVKIDGSFVRHVATDDADRAIVEGLTLLAQRMGCQVIAMNVGDAATLQQVVALGVDHVQGFHIGRPMPIGKQP